MTLHADGHLLSTSSDAGSPRQATSDVPVIDQTSSVAHLGRGRLGQAVGSTLGDDHVRVAHEPVPGGGGERLRHDGVKPDGWRLLVTATLRRWLEIVS